jgi:hypothetical protein
MWSEWKSRFRGSRPFKWSQGSRAKPIKGVRPEVEILEARELLDGSAVFGQDTRMLVPPNSIVGEWSHSPLGPFSAIGFVQNDIPVSDGPSGTYGTGFMVGPNLLLTAAHVVYARDDAGALHVAQPGDITVRLGRSFDVEGTGDSNPFGVAHVKQIYVPAGWEQTVNGTPDNLEHDPADDYALLVLDQPYGSSTGWFGIYPAPDNFFTGDQYRYGGVALSSAGYPGDQPALFWNQPGLPNPAQDTSMYVTYGPCSSASSGTIEFAAQDYSGQNPYSGLLPMFPGETIAQRIQQLASYGNTIGLDSAGGQSGSPIWFTKIIQIGSGPVLQPEVVGILVAGGPNGITGTRITSAVINQINAWVNGNATGYYGIVASPSGVTAGAGSALMSGESTVWFLSADGSLAYRSTPGSPTVTVQGGVTTFAADSSGGVYALTQAGVLLHFDAAGNQTWAKYGIQSFASVNAGNNIFALQNNGELIYFNNGSWSSSQDNVSAIASSDNSSIFELLSDGRLYALTASGSLTYLDSGVSSIASSGGSACFELQVDGRLFAHYNDSAGHYTYLDSGVSSIAGTGGPACFELMADGRLYAHNGDSAGHYTYLDSGVSSIAGTGGPICFELAVDGRLWSMNLVGSDTYLDSGVSSIASSGGPACFELLVDGRLAAHYSINPGDYIWLDSGVLAIATGGGPRVFDLHSDGTLYAQTLAAAGYMDGGSSTLDHGVAAIAGSGGPRVFDLHADGTLYAQTLAASGYLDGGASTLDSGVLAIAGSGGPRVFDLHSDGTLYAQTLAAAGYMDGGSSTLDHGVAAIAGSGGPRVFDLHADGTLYAQTLAASGYLDGGASTLDSGVLAIASSGGPQVFDLHAGGTLYWQTLAPAGYMDGGGSALDSGVATIAGSGGPRVFDLHTDGTLYAQTLAPAGYMDGGASTLDQGVVAIACSGGPWVFDLHANGMLYAQTLAAAGYLDGGASTLDHGVAAIAGPGGPRAFDLHAGGIYNGSALVAQGCVVGVSGPAPVAGTWSYTYYAGSAASGTPLAGPPAAAGTYTVVATFTSSDPDYSSGCVSATFTIAPATPTLSVAAAGGIFNGLPTAVNGAAVGLDGVTPVAGSWSYAYYAGSTATGTPLAGAPTAVGTYTVVGSFTSSDPNYTSAASTPTTFTISPGVARQLTITGLPTSTTAGVANGFTVTALDAYGNVATGYNGTVHFSSSDVQAGLPGDYTFAAADRGTHTFTATLKAAGTPWLKAADTANAALVATDLAVTVSHAAASRFQVVGPGGVTAGTATSLTVTVQDAYGNLVPEYAGTVHFTSSDKKATLPPDYTFTATDHGVHTFSGKLTLKTAGAQTVTGTDKANPALAGISPAIQVGAAAATSFKVSSSSASTTAGKAVSVTVSVLDAYGNLVVGYAGTVHFSSTDVKAALPPDYTFTAVDKGSHTFTNVVLTTAGSQTVTVTDTAKLTLKATATVKVSAAAASRLVVSGPTAVTAGTAFTFTVRAVDAYGNTATGYRGKVHFTSSDTLALLPSDYIFTSSDLGVHTFTATLRTKGSQALTVTDLMAASLTATQSGIGVS